MISPSIHFIFTGGTIDSYYEATKDTAAPNKQSVIPGYIANLKLYNKTEFTEVCMKDSREINNTDRENVLKVVEGSKHSQIIITHGTYTMPDTARYLQEHLKRNDQVIILTGATLPMTEFVMSDGPFNLGFAIAKSQELEPGVYVSMNGRIFTPNEVIKVLSEGRFDSILGEKSAE